MRRRKAPAKAVVPAALSTDPLSKSQPSSLSIRKSKLSKTLFVLPLSPFSLAVVLEIDVLEVGTPQNIPNLLLKLESYQHLNKMKGTICLE